MQRIIQFKPLLHCKSEPQHTARNRNIIFSTILLIMSVSMVKPWELYPISYNERISQLQTLNYFRCVRDKNNIEIHWWWQWRITLKMIHKKTLHIPSTQTEGQLNSIYMQILNAVIYIYDCQTKQIRSWKQNWKIESLQCKKNIR